ncbi:DeoR/GlpR family DNA-binding transcription regulator [Oceanispirochaeta sp.]|jgi:DeoR/GlpR family transcriptional regulator of sugar metabolism|uniref:DeoR/GlpR family DNA-binding transcription regulator n=1 Tax=Oceanispirochaeta sp. TaxID=2035350 RepID=UPI002604413D|nr:DeoR/GlpR family DNA-binding transcription regulator [Oceanispirochaeta sp.]MDA3958613.1 DeoR/GlpR family DNA-binding transcription regulator [Oceanispirochaeta sp.]
MIERHEEILNLVSEGKEISVQELSDQLAVSLVTIRSDLRVLEENGLLVRTRGGAELSSEDDIARRMGINYSIKQKIASKAVSFINEGDTIFLEAGSCIALMARELKVFSSLNVLTNNAFVARQMKDAPGVKVILLGGEFQKDSETMVGPMIREYLSYYNFSKVFLGMDGFTLDQGAMCRDLDRAEVMAEFVAAGEDVFILSDSSKFGMKGIRVFAEIRDIDRIITDSHISETMKDSLSHMNVSVYCVS